MKKVILTVVAVLIVALGCFVLFKKANKVQKAELVVENVISTDKEDMFLHYANDYRWYESCILLENFLDEENDGTIAGISNVFQFLEGEEGSYDPKVVLYSHTRDTSSVEVKDGFWVEDYPMNDEPIAVTFKQAYELVMRVDMPKPHSRHVVLRKEIGPFDCNPQYIFGNLHAQIYVDAITGAVSDKSPAFNNDSITIQKPLGEWP